MALAIGAFAQATPNQVFASSTKVRVLLFVRTDCPISNRYAPELRRIANEFASQDVQFWLVYSGASENRANIRDQVKEFHLPGTVVLDPAQKLAARAEATVTPQAAVFDKAGQLKYSGRIDDRWVDFGKSRPVAQTHDLEAAINATLADRSVAQPRTRAIGCYLEDVK